MVTYSHQESLSFSPVVTVSLYKLLHISTSLSLEVFTCFDQSQVTFLTSLCSLYLSQKVSVSLYQSQPVFTWSLSVSTSLYLSLPVSSSHFHSLVVSICLQWWQSFSSRNSLCLTDLICYWHSLGVTICPYQSHCLSLEVTVYLYEQVPRSLHLSRPISSDIF